AIENHCDVAIANKETLVAGGDIVNDLVDKYNVNLIPVDSEHSAIFQTINGYDKKDIKKLIITASGGAFRDLKRSQLNDVNLQQALNHPQWKMGAKITVDSATMMNKGFEVIEAHQLFRLPYQQIDVLLHPQSIVHSLTEFVDHSILAQMGVADMRIPIQYALTYPHRLINTCESLSLAEVGCLNFQQMDYERFPLLDLAYCVGYKGGNMPAILNGANETAVNLFLNNKISFLDIERIVFATVEAGRQYFIAQPSLEDILKSNDWAQNKALELSEV
ncbi:MAG: 1-deoxy-D-xylulose-5-phosphate reductoisomerase, partial [Erysipelotrichia bacterium]|nr:1-deoxy-D-xylulose-5-phosphate reductoisomerase [Erysipelotrichia bacterium]